MLAIFADESDDRHTYTLGGWAITPIHCGIFGEQWNAMLQTIKLADGSPCPAFHASAMIRQKPPFGGWADEAAHQEFLRTRVRQGYGGDRTGRAFRDAAGGRRGRDSGGV